MFGSLKSMGAVASLLQNKDKLEAVGTRVKQRVDELRVEGSSGQGAVRATVTGTMAMVGLHLEPALAKAESIEITLTPSSSALMPKTAWSIAGIRTSSASPSTR